MYASKVIIKAKGVISNPDITQKIVMYLLLINK